MTETAKRDIDNLLKDIVELSRNVEGRDVRIKELEAALKAVIGMLDDPTGSEHIRDMRGATIIARAVLKGGTK